MNNDILGSTNHIFPRIKGSCPPGIFSCGCVEDFKIKRKNEACVKNAINKPSALLLLAPGISRPILSF